MSTKRPRISVALCTYNGSRFIGSQLSSILNQSHTPDEIVICDDGSNDCTVDIIKDMTKDTDICIRLFMNQANLGFVKNFEKAIDLCSGDVIFLSDQDDVWYPNKIESMLQPFLEDNKIGLVYSDAEIVDESLGTTGKTVFSTRRIAQLAHGQERNISEVIDKPGLKGCLMAFRSNLRSILLPVPEIAKEFGWCHDHWIAQICYAVTGIRVINCPLMHYRRSDQTAGNDGDLISPERKLGFTQSIRRSVHANVDLVELVAQRKIKGYEPMLERLMSIRSEYPELVCDLDRLNCYIIDYQNRVEFIQKRVDLRKLTRTRRLPIAIKLLFKGAYNKYFRGGRSFLRDILAK